MFGHLLLGGAFVQHLPSVPGSTEQIRPGRACATPGGGAVLVSHPRLAGRLLHIHRHHAAYNLYVSVLRWTKAANHLQQRQVLFGNAQACGDENPVHGPAGRARSGKGTDRNHRHASEGAKVRSACMVWIEYISSCFQMCGAVGNHLSVGFSGTVHTVRNDLVQLGSVRRRYGN